MNRIISVIMACAVMCSLFVGCAKQQDPTQNTTTPGNTNPSTVPGTTKPDDSTKPSQPQIQEPASAQAILENIWTAWDFEYKDYFVGGSMENAVSGAPGAVDITDTETLQYQYYIPEANLTDVQGAASVMHGMNANIFTAAAFKVSDAAAFAAIMKDALLNAQFVCGSPASLMVYTVGNGYVLFAFGDTENLDSFRTALNTVYSDAVSVFDGLMG